MAYLDRWDSFFDLLDADNSGFISMEDVTEGSKLTARAKEGSPEYAETARIYKEFVIDFTDTDGDGKVTREELRAAAKKIVGGGVEKVPEWFINPVKAQINLADSNKSGDFSLDEITAFVKNSQPQTSDAAILNAFNWALKLTGRERENTLTEAGYMQVFWVYAASPDPAPEAEILFAFFRKPTL